MQIEGTPRNTVSAPTEPIIHYHTQILKLISGDAEFETAEEEGIQTKGEREVTEKGRLYEKNLAIQVLLKVMA